MLIHLAMPKRMTKVNPGVGQRCALAEISCSSRAFIITHTHNTFARHTQLARIHIADTSSSSGFPACHHASRKSRRFNRRQAVRIQAAAHLIVRMAPLHDAARGDPAKVSEILAQGNVDVDARDRHSRTPLHLAAWAGQVLWHGRSLRYCVALLQRVSDAESACQLQTTCNSVLACIRRRRSRLCWLQALTRMPPQQMIPAACTLLRKRDTRTS